MPPKKYALKGEPDFHNLSDEKVKSFLDLTQQLIFCYKGVDDTKVQVLREIWKDLSNESVERLCNSPAKTPVKDSPCTLLKKAPKMRRSPAKR